MSTPAILRALTLMIPAIACAMLACWAWRKRPSPGAGPLAFVMLCASWWSLWYAVELLTLDPSGQLSWTKLQYVGIATLPVSWLVFSLHHTGRQRLVTPGRLALLLAVPVAVVLAAWTNEWHHLMWVQVWPVIHGSLHTYATIRGPVYWLNVAYGHVMVTTGTILIIFSSLRAPRIYRAQSVVALLGALAPWLTNIAYLAGLSPIPGLDPTPYAFIVTGLLVVWSLSRLHFLGLIPVARESVLAAMRDGVLVLDDENRVLEANPAARRLLGNIPAGTPVAEVLPERLPSPEESPPDQPAVMLMRSDGAERLLEVSVSQLTAEAGRTRGSVVLIRDATRRLRAENALREALQRFESVVQNAPLVAIQGFDREGRVLHWNHASEVLYGYSREEAMGRHVAELVLSEAERDDFGQRLDAVWDDGTPAPPREWEVQTRSGTHRIVYSSMFPVHEQGEVVEVFCMNVDVTERKQVERAERLAAVGQLAAGVAHEFNNLMAAMMLRAEMTNTEDPAHVAQLVDIVLKSTRRGSETCRNLMAFARPRTPRREPLELEAIVDAALRVAALQLDNAQIQVTRSYRADGSRVEGDAGQLEQVFLNLIINACHAMSGGSIPPERRQLTLTVQPERLDGSHWLVACVADTGPGISPEKLGLVFEPFFTTKRDSGEGAGTGLGLPVSRGIVEAHGGHIEVHSQPGEGTCFEVWIPATAPTSPEQLTLDSKPMPRPKPPDLTARRVLVAEDDVDVRALLIELLEGCGARVTAASATGEAMAAFAQSDYDIVVTDIMMPGGGGEELLAAVTGSDRGVPVVVITGKADPMLEDHLLQLGAAAVLRKPFSISDVYQTAAMLLSS